MVKKSRKNMKIHFNQSKKKSDDCYKENEYILSVNSHFILGGWERPISEMLTFTPRDERP